MQRRATAVQHAVRRGRGAGGSCNVRPCGGAAAVQCCDHQCCAALRCTRCCMPCGARARACVCASTAAAAAAATHIVGLAREVLPPHVGFPVHHAAVDEPGRPVQHHAHPLAGGEVHGAQERDGLRWLPPCTDGASQRGGGVGVGGCGCRSGCGEGGVGCQNTPRGAVTCRQPPCPAAASAPRTLHATTRRAPQPHARPTAVAACT